MIKYKFYNYTSKSEVDGGKQTVCAASTYAGKTVKGYAKCDPRDNFDMEKGKKLAAARCNMKVGKKRLLRAEMKMQEAAKQVIEAKQYFNEMKKYYQDAFCSYTEAKLEVEDLLETM